MYVKSSRLSVWQRYAGCVMLVGIIYVIGVGVLRASLLRQALPENGPIKSKAPSLQFQNSLGSRVPTTSSMTPWLEMVSGKNVDEPRIFIVHNIINDAECEHLIALALKRGLQKSLITPYGSHNLVESSTRTNMQAWLEYAEDAVVIGIEERIAKITKTYPEQGENMQVLLALKAVKCAHSCIFVSRWMLARAANHVEVAKSQLSLQLMRCSWGYFTSEL